MAEIQNELALVENIILGEDRNMGGDDNVVFPQIVCRMDEKINVLRKKGLYYAKRHQGLLIYDIIVVVPITVILYYYGYHLLKTIKSKDIKCLIISITAFSTFRIALDIFKGFLNHANPPFK